MNLNKEINLIQGDCLEIMKEIPNKSIDLVLIDPPYNTNKADWDKWETVDDYVEFMGQVFLECQRVLKDNGSFYFFHDDFLQIVELQNWINKNTKFKFKQLLVWNKRFEETANKSLKAYLDAHCKVEGLRNYKKMAEYCLFYTFQDETGINKNRPDVNNFKNLRDYFKYIQSEIGLNKKQIIEKIGQKADHCFRYSSSQWNLPVEETYDELIEVFNIDKYKGFRTYKELRQEYESLRYTFNNQKLHHSVMNYEVPPRRGHITPKNTDMLEYIIKTSSNKGDVVLDCFMGSGSTGVACINTSRKFIGIEKDEKYFEVACNRIKEVRK